MFEKKILFLKSKFIDIFCSARFSKPIAFPFVLQYPFCSKSKDNRNKYLEGLRPYFEFTNLKSNQIKNGSKVIKVNLREKRQIENVRNLGANEKQSAANQRLLWFSVNSPVSIKKPKVEINERDKLCMIIY